MASALERSASFAQSRSSGHHLSRITARAGRRARAKAEAATAAGKGTRGGARASHPSPYDIIGSYGPTPRHTHRTRRLAAASTVHTTPAPPPPTFSRAPRRATASPISPSPARFAAFIRAPPVLPAPGVARLALGVVLCLLSLPYLSDQRAPGLRLLSSAAFSRLVLGSSPPPRGRGDRDKSQGGWFCVFLSSLLLPCLALSHSALASRVPVGPPLALPLPGWSPSSFFPRFVRSQLDGWIRYTSL